MSPRVTNQMVVDFESDTPDNRAAGIRALREKGCDTFEFQAELDLSTERDLLRVVGYATENEL